MSIHRRFLAAHWGVDLYAKFLILALWGHTLKLLNRWQWNLAHCRGARVHTILQNFTKITHGSIQSSGKFLNFDSFGARDPHPSTDKVEIWQGSANPRSVAEAMDPDCHPYTGGLRKNIQPKLLLDPRNSTTLHEGMSEPLKEGIYDVGRLICRDVRWIMQSQSLL